MRTSRPEVLDCSLDHPEDDELEGGWNVESEVENGRREVRDRVPSQFSKFTDEELIERYRGGEVDAFTELDRRYRVKLFNYLRSHLNNAELAEDIVQETFLRVHQKADTYESGRRFSSWIYAIATNQAIDKLRQMGRRRIASLDEQAHVDSDGEATTFASLLEGEREIPPLDQLLREEGAESIRHIVRSLPPILYEVIDLYYYQGMKYREIAELLGIPDGTVKSRMRTAKIMLAKELLSRAA